MSPLIKVLLVDDSPLVLKGWRLVLIADPEIQVEEAPVAAVLKAGLPSPDVFLIKATTFFHLHAEELVLLLKSLYPLSKILVVVDTNTDLNKARQLGADEAIQSPIGKGRLIDLVRGLFQDDKSLCEYYVEQLQAVKPGKEDAYRYEKLMCEIIQLLFADHLTGMERQSSTTTRIERRDLVFFNQSEHSFWRTVRLQHEADQVIFEFKNKVVSEKDFYQLLTYLEPPMGRFGVLIARQPLNQANCERQKRAYLARKVILFLSDADIRNLLAYKAAGVEPSEYLQDLYSELKRRI